MASPFLVQVRIADEVQANIQIANWLRECLERQMEDAVGTKSRTGVDNKTVQAWRDVVKALEALADTKIRLDKNAKTMAEQMSPEEELQAVRAYIRSLDPTTRSQFLTNEQRWHERREEGIPEREPRK